jgi:hypothetical protein
MMEIWLTRPHIEPEELNPVALPSSAERAFSASTTTDRAVSSVATPPRARPAGNVQVRRCRRSTIAGLGNRCFIPLSTSVSRGTVGHVSGEAALDGWLASSVSFGGGLPVQQLARPGRAAIRGSGCWRSSPRSSSRAEAARRFHAPVTVATLLSGELPLLISVRLRRADGTRTASTRRNPPAVVVAAAVSTVTGEVGTHRRVLSRQIPAPTLEVGTTGADPRERAATGAIFP